MTIFLCGDAVGGGDLDFDCAAEGVEVEGKERLAVHDSHAAFHALHGPLHNLHLVAGLGRRDDAELLRLLRGLHDLMKLAQDSAGVRQGLHEDDGVRLDDAQTLLFVQPREDVAGEERDLSPDRAALHLANLDIRRQDVPDMPCRKVGLQLLLCARLGAQNVPDAVVHRFRKHSARVDHSCDSPLAHPVDAGREFAPYIT